MIHLYKKDKSDEIIKYIGNNYYKSLYLYLNYTKYSVTKNEITLYIQVECNEIKSLLLVYGNTLHILSTNNDYDINEICNFIKENNFSVICSDGETIKKIYSLLDIECYDESIGSVLELKRINNNIKTSYDEKVKIAKKEDFDRIVKFLLEDNEKEKIYSKENLYKQICNRNEENYGRNYIIKCDDNIIAHAGTGAENDKIAVINLVMVDEKYRGKGYATTIVKKLCRDLLSENKICYLMTLSSNVEKLYEKIGFYKKSTYGKLIRK